MGVARDRFPRTGIRQQQPFQCRALDRRLAIGRHQPGALHRAAGEVGVQRGIVLQVQLVLALLDLVQRRQADVDVAAIDQLRHLPVEEGQQQGADMAAVHVGVGHDDDAVVAQFIRVIFVLADAGAERGDQGADLGAGQHAVEARALDVEDLAAQRQHRLGLAVAALLGAAAGRVALDDEQFRQRRVLLRAIGQLAGQAGDVQRAFAAGEVACLAGGFTGAGGIHDLAGDGLGFIRVFLQELLQPRSERTVHHRAHVRGHQLFLGLAGEAGIRHLHREHRDHAFAHVIARQRHLGLLGNATLLDVIGQGAGQRRAEALQMGAAVFLRDVVGEAEHRFLIGVGPLQGDIHGDAVLLAGHRDHVRVQRGFHLRQMLDEALDAAFVLEHVVAAFLALVLQRDPDPGIEEAQLAQASRQDVVMEFDITEGFGGGPEAQRGAALVALLPQPLERMDRLAVGVFLLVVATIAPDVQCQFARKRIDHADTHAVQATGHLVAVVVELAAGVQHGEDHLGCRHTLFLVDVHRDAAAVVGHTDRTIGVDGDKDVVGVAGQCLVHRVVDHFEHHVVQAGAVMDIADVHARTLAHRFQPAQDGDFAGIVVGVRGGFGRGARGLFVLRHRRVLLPWRARGTPRHISYRSPQYSRPGLSPMDAPQESGYDDTLECKAPCST